MSKNFLDERRRLLKGMGGLFSAGAAAALLPQLALLPQAAHAQSRGATGYRALVCIYLAGANDSYNFLVPRDSEAAGSRYDLYRTARGGVYGPSNTSGLALPFADLLPVNPLGEATAYGLHPACTDFTATAGASTQNHSGLQTLFNSGKAGFVCNMGPLIQPLTLAQYNAGAPRPAQLFSHNDQELLWQIGVGDGSSPVARHGWGGRVARQIGAPPLSNGLSPTVSIAGAARFLIGDGLMPYQLSAQGADMLDSYVPSQATGNFAVQRRAALDQLLNAGGSDAYSREYATLMRRALGVGEDLFGLLNATDGSGNVQTVFPAGNTLAAQLAMVARMIKVSRASLSATRQVYYVRFGSFDLHDGMFAAGQPVASSGHGALLTTLNQALGAFWTALGEIGAQDQVVSFTMSEFARTLSGNGNGSDHAWGGNQLVLGNAVQGNRLYGRYPALRLNSNDNTAQEWSLSRGQYLPTTSVDQYAATLARWMGVTDSAALNAVFPLLPNFGSSDLGFLSA